MPNLHCDELFDQLRQIGGIESMNSDGVVLFENNASVKQKASVTKLMDEEFPTMIPFAKPLPVETPEMILEQVKQLMTKYEKMTKG